MAQRDPFVGDHLLGSADWPVLLQPCARAVYWICPRTCVYASTRPVCSSEYVFELHVCKLQVSWMFRRMRLLTLDAVWRLVSGRSVCRLGECLVSLDDSICMLSRWVIEVRGTCAFLLRLEAPTLAMHMGP